MRETGRQGAWRSRMAAWLLLLPLAASAGDEGAGTFGPLHGTGVVARTQLGFDALTAPARRLDLIDFSNYAMPAAAAMPANRFEGRLTLSAEAVSGNFVVHVDDRHDVDGRDSPRKHLPKLDVELVQVGSHIVPLQRGAIASNHPDWEFVLAPGRVWNEAGDHGYSRVALPFALEQKNANCMHNGVLTFLFRDDGAITNAAYQIASETCLYFKADLWGILPAHYAPHAVAGAAEASAGYRREIAARMPVKPLAALAREWPGTRLPALAAPNGKNPRDISLVGLVVDGVHYVGGCATRRGLYPYCESLVVPSYSTAKSVFAGLALMRLERLHPGVFDESIAAHVPACANGRWNDVTFGNALDMATGNYASAAYMRDEDAESARGGGFFDAPGHAEKIADACNAYPRKATPGTTWVYHTSDTYVLGAAMNAWLKSRQGARADIFDDVLWSDVLKPLAASPTAAHTRRTYDDVRQPFTGWGLTWLSDDVAKIGNFLAAGSRAQTLVDQAKLDAALQRVPTDRGLAPLPGFRYNHGFWAHEVSAKLPGCRRDVWIPFLSGYGGITLLILPNRMAYYYFSDDGSPLWMDAVLEAHRMRSLCP